MNNQRSHAEAGVVAIQNILDDGTHEDALFVMDKAGVILDALHEWDGMPDIVRDRIDEARDALLNGNVLMEREMNR